MWTDSKTVLGGGAKIKAPKWATGLGKTASAIDDSVLPSILFPILDPTIAAPESEETETETEESEAVESGEEAAKNSEGRRRRLSMHWRPSEEKRLLLVAKAG